MTDIKFEQTEDGWIICDLVKNLEEIIISAKSILFNYLDTQYPNAECLSTCIEKHHLENDIEHYRKKSSTFLFQFQYNNQPVILATQNLSKTKLSAFIDCAYPIYNGKKRENRQQSCINAVNKLVAVEPKISAAAAIISELNYLYQIPIKTGELDQSKQHDLELILLHWEMALNPERRQELEFNIAQLSDGDMDRELQAQLLLELNNIYTFLDTVAVRPVGFEEKAERRLNLSIT